MRDKNDLRALFGGLNLLAGVLLRVVQLHELGDIELGCLEHLHLADVDILKGVDSLARLLNSLSDGLGDELLDELLQVARGGFLGHDIHHLLTDGADLSRLSVAGLLALVLSLLGEGNGEQTKSVSVGGGDINVSLDEGLPLLNHGAELIGGEVHSVEVGEARASLNVLNSQLDVAVELILIVVKISQVGLENASLEVINSVTLSG